MKIFILKDIKEGAWGGANQFFRLLKKKFEQRAVLALTPHDADIILIDSYQRLQESLHLKKKYPEKKYIFRLGPMFYLHRGWHWKSMDRLVVAVVNACADGIIFQSAWSKEKFTALGIHESIHATVIHNSADRSIFQYKKRNISRQQKEKIHIVSSSWSANKLKGGEHVAYLDQQIGKKFQFTFIGNTTYTFEHIVHVSPKESDALAEIMDASQIYVSAAAHEACSNAIVEAMSLGLPVVALDSGANKEIIGDRGVLYQKKEDILQAIDTCIASYDAISERLAGWHPDAASAYIIFFEHCILKRNVLTKRIVLLWLKLKATCIFAFIKLVDKIVY